MSEAEWHVLLQKSISTESDIRIDINVITSIKLLSNLIVAMCWVQAIGYSKFIRSSYE